ncbi:MAG: hypothetical protein ACYTAF_03905 [Planctomycetota bacterium]|jgi:hypothetical protein
MKLTEIPVGKALEGSNWIIEQRDAADPAVIEAVTFTGSDTGLFASIIRMNDGSEHVALVRKEFSDGGVHTDTFVYTKTGWVNLFDDGFMRAVGRYHHDIFPFEIFIGRPWKGDRDLAAEGAEKIKEHREMFAQAVERLRPLLVRG